HLEKRSKIKKNFVHTPLRSGCHELSKGMTLTRIFKPVQKLDGREGVRKPPLSTKVKKVVLSPTKSLKFNNFLSSEMRDSLKLTYSYAEYQKFAGEDPRTPNFKQN